MKVAILALIWTICLPALASDRVAYLCGGYHPSNPRKYSTEFFVVVDLSTARWQETTGSVEAYLETTPKSRIPEQGFSDVATLELLSFEKLGDTIHFNVQAHNLLINGGRLTFFTLGMETPDDGRHIHFSGYVGQVPIDGSCRRRQDQDSLWKRQ